MSDDILEALKKDTAEREKNYTRFKGMLEGIRLARKPIAAEKDILDLFEYVIDGFKNASDSFNFLGEMLVRLGQRIDSLEKDVKQLQKTIDTLQENV